MCDKRFVRWSAISIFLCGLIQPVMASPWVEPDDPMLRVNLQILADAGLLHAPLTTYPLPWALISDDLEAINPATFAPHLNLAYRYVKHYYQDAKLGRGNKRMKLVAGNQPPYRLGYGSFARDEWGGYTSYELTDQRFSLRVNGNYTKGPDGKKKFNLQGSYFALAKGHFTFDVGELERWWGPGWQSSLSWSQNANAIPAFSIAWFGQHTPLVGDWSWVAMVGKLDSNSPNDYLWATRLSVRPWRWLELGASFQSYWGASSKSWYGELPQVIVDNESTARRQSSLDLRLQLPTMGDVSQGIYGQWVSRQQQTLPASYLVGWESSWFIGGQQAHLVFERQKTLRSYWISAHTDPEFAFNEGRRINDQRLATLWSAGGYLLFSNDQQLQLFVHRIHFQDQSLFYQPALEYQLPLGPGQLHIGADYRTRGAEGDRLGFWLGWDFRF